MRSAVPPHAIARPVRDARWRLWVIDRRTDGPKNKPPGVSIQRSVFSRSLDAIDHEDLHRTGGRFEPEAELLLADGEERRPGILWSGCGSRDPAVGTERT